MPSKLNHPSFPITIDISQKIWRYMDFTEFAYLLTRKLLWFNRVDKFEDPFEGTYPLKNLQELRNSEHAILEPSFKQLRQFTYINCWYISDHESAAMWKLYAETNMAVAIQTTYDKLHKNMPEKCYIGEISYLDYETEFIDISNAFSPHMIKRKAFSHEKELRALIQDKLPTKENPNGEGEMHDIAAINKKDGLLISIDPNQLIEKIHIAPMSPNWYKDLVVDFLVGYGFSKEDILVSELDTEPY